MNARDIFSGLGQKKGRSAWTPSKGGGGLAFLCGFLLAVLAGLGGGFLRECATAPEGVLRLHIIANSDGGFDQEVKLRVRDAVTERAREVLGGVPGVDCAGAKAVLEAHRGELESAAEGVLAAHDCGYGARVEIGRSWFPGRVYGGEAYPAGEYEAVKVVLGEGEGRNWWCVIFPGLCMPAAGATGEAGLRFWLWEWLVQLWQQLQP